MPSLSCVAFPSTLQSNAAQHALGYEMRGGEGVLPRVSGEAGEGATGRGVGDGVNRAMGPSGELGDRVIGPSGYWRASILSTGVIPKVRRTEGPAAPRSHV
jgi:hypothetical protein